ncbi:MAG: CoA-acylating methylmalonate-semialdehyde dehydrogenase [Anaerolineae bacterium]|nr:CoA-acylating methylmalonate-semialdehyde dehydrogenase [Anaerolineae bacterium]
MSAKVVRNYVNGSWVTSKSTRRQQVYNPATQEVIAEVPLSTKEEVDKAVQKAHDAFHEWRTTPPYTRARAMFKLKNGMEARFEDLARMVTTENGKTIDEARAEVRRAIENVELAAGIPTQMMGYNLEDVAQGIDEVAIRQPLGVCASINPFNFPNMVPLWFLPVAIACGNTYITKPSPITPVSQELLFELLDECDLPDGVVNLVHGDEEVVNALIDHPLVRALSFVGSSRVGKIIYERSAMLGKRVQAQGGAKNHMLVMPDADLPKSIANIMGSSYGCAGQRCLAGSVLITVGNIHKQVVDGLAEAASRLRVGYGLNETTQMGPVITQQSLKRVHSYLERGQEEGATLILDGRQVKVQDCPDGNFVGPSIFDNANSEMSIVKDEIFGPVLSVMNVPDFDSGIEALEKSRYGNAASIFTQDGGHAREFKYRVRAGNIGINIGVAAPVASFPFGGMKDSFFGDLHGQGPDAINFFTDRKVVIERWF